MVPPGESVRFCRGGGAGVPDAHPIIQCRIVGSNELLPLEVPQRAAEFRPQQRVTVCFGKTLDPEDHATPGDLLRDLRWSVYALG